MTVEQAINLSDFYQLMAIAWQYPTKELVEGILAGTFGEDVADCLVGLGVDPEEADALSNRLQEAARAEAESAEALLKAMRVEYTGLFLVPMKEKVFLYESRFCYPKDANPKDYMVFVSPCALHAEQAYKEAGVRVRASLQEPADHIVTELEFMAHVYRKAAESLHSEAKDADLWLWRAKTFREFHLDKWYEDFLAQVLEVTESETYRMLAILGGIKFDVSGSDR